MPGASSPPLSLRTNIYVDGFNLYYQALKKRPEHTKKQYFPFPERATHLVADAFRGSFDVAVVLSNDTDLVEPVRVVTGELKKPVGIFCPCENVATSLKEVATFIRHITAARLGQSQFPDTIPGTTIMRPASWVAAPGPAA